jgi:hypothetical protein
MNKNNRRPGNNSRKFISDVVTHTHTQDETAQHKSSPVAHGNSNIQSIHSLDNNIPGITDVTPSKETRPATERHRACW